MILHQDDVIVVVNKPAGMPVHRSRLVSDGDVYLIDVVRAQVPGPLHLIHRLDRATSGVLLIGRSPEVAATLGQQFMQREVEKTYLAVCRGWPAESGTLDYPLPGVRENSERKAAITHWRRLQTTEVSIAINRYPQQRYALVEDHAGNRPLPADPSPLRPSAPSADRRYQPRPHRTQPPVQAVLRFTSPAAARAQPELQSSADGANACASKQPLDTEFTRVLHAFGWLLPHATSRASSALPHPLL
jgi:hypothetical protein